jgi:hypothetical protein
LLKPLCKPAVPSDSSVHHLLAESGIKTSGAKLFECHLPARLASTCLLQAGPHHASATHSM